MHDAGALLQRDEVAEVDRRRAVVERMAERQPFQLRSLCGGDRFSVESVTLQAALDEVYGEHQVPAPRRNQRVLDVRMHVQRLVGRNRPRGRRPNHRRDRRVGRCVEPERPRELHPLCRIGQRKHHVDRNILAILVFDFGFGERAVAIEAPVDRLQASVEIALLQQAAERADLVGLVAIPHRGVMMVPVAEDAEALEIRLLQRDLLGRVCAAKPLRVRDRQVLAVGLLDLHFDRHPVAVPARNVRRVEAGELFALDDDVLEDLVDRRADVDRGIRVRGPVVQDELRPPATGDADRLVDFPLLPVRDPARLAPGEIAAHGERRVGQIQRRLVIGLRIVGHRFVNSGSRNIRGPMQRRRGSAARVCRDRQSALRRAACAGIARGCAVRKSLARSRR